MLLVVLLLAHARAEWVEITQLRKPTRTHLTDSIDFHDDKISRPPFTEQPSSFDDEKRKNPQLWTENIELYEENKPRVSTLPNDHYEAKRFKPHFSIGPTDIHDGKWSKPQFSTDPIDYNEKISQLPTQFSTEPGFLADYKRNRIYINHTIDHSLEKHWSTRKGVVHRVPSPTIGSVKRIYLTTEEPAKVKYEETDLTHELSQGYTMRNPFKNYEDRKPEFVTKEETFENDDEDELHFFRNPPNDIPKGDEVKSNNYLKNNDLVRRVDTDGTDPIKNETSSTGAPTDEDHSEKTAESAATANTMENVVKFVKVVADTISRNTRRGVSSKLRYLEDLKETIMTNIEDRIESLWPDDSRAARRRRRARAAQARGHVEFPSSESTLMTISFLTFAVYLIKLILQVIHAYKNKTMMVTPAVFAAVGRAASGKHLNTP